MNTDPFFNIRKSLSPSLYLIIYLFIFILLFLSHNKRSWRSTFSLIGAGELAFPPPENQPNPLLGVAKIRMAGQRSSEMAGRGSTKSTETFSPLSSISNSDTIVQSNWEFLRLITSYEKILLEEKRRKRRRLICLFGYEDKAEGKLTRPFCCTPPPPLWWPPSQRCTN